MSIHVQSPFGGCDEQAETDAFERLVGGPTMGFRLLNIWRNCYAPVRTKSDIFRIRAKMNGYTDEQIDAFLHLQ